MRRTGQRSWQTCRPIRCRSQSSSKLVSRQWVPSFGSSSADAKFQRMFRIDLSTSHWNSEYLDAFNRYAFLHYHGDLFYKSTFGWSAYRTEIDFWSVLSRSYYLFNVLDTLSHVVLSFAGDFEIFQQVNISFYCFSFRKIKQRFLFAD